MKLSNLKIGTRLRWGLAIILSMIIVLGVLSWTQAKKIEQQTIDLYEHPLTVRTTLGEIRTDVLIMKLWMKELAPGDQRMDVVGLRGRMEVQKAHVLRLFNILYDRYLGPRADIDKAFDRFIEWNSINDEAIRLHLDGKTGTVSEGTTTNLLALLLGDIQKIDDFAKAKSTSFYLRSMEVNKALNIQLGYWVAGIFLLIFFLFSTLMKGIRLPLEEINSAILRFRSGDLNARSKHVSGDEFGILASSFNDLAETAQSVSDMNDRAIRLDQLMLSEEDAHRFCRALLGALLDDTHSRMGAVYLLNEEKTRFEHFESIGILSAGCKPFSATSCEGEFGQALVTRKLQHLTQIPDDTRFTFATVTGEFLPREIITLPVLSGNEVIAVISLASVKCYTANSLKLLQTIQGTLNARMGGILANRKILEFSQMLEYQNIELETQKNELSAQTSELMEQNIELEMQKKQLDESNRLKTTFLSNMSHELRTPLNSVIALSAVLNRRLSGKVPEEEYSYLEVIERNGKNLLSLINDILDLSRIEAGREELEIENVDAGALVGEIVEMIEPQARQKNISLRYFPGPGSSIIQSDYEKMRHILQNIVANAVKFTEKGFVEIRILEKDTNLCIEVTDTGIGIGENNLTDIFDEFKQADGSNSRKYGGTGLGLSIAKKYAEMLGGCIEVESTYGAGSRFTVILPICLENEPLPDGIISDLYRSRPKFTESMLDQFRNLDKTILLVEDTESVVIQMKDMLESEGYNLMVAHNGMEALEQISLKVPDGVILDLMMPEVDGFEVLRSIREDQMAEDLPVIILTAKYITKEELSFLKKNHIHQLIHKGDINKDQLLNAVASMVCPETVVPSKPTERRTTVQTSEIPVVLIVEDNPDNMLTIKALLSGRCRVVEASDGKSGIEKTYQYKPDLVLMDIALPGINGIEVLKELRKDDELGHIPIIAVSASAMKGDRENLMAHGFDGYLSKPIEARLFFEIIDEWIALA